jgi:hypothetical protein
MNHIELHWIHKEKEMRKIMVLVIIGVYLSGAETAQLRGSFAPGISAGF